MSSTKMSDVESSLIKLNNLQYTVPESLSVVISKQFKYFPSDKTSYRPKETVFATLSTGQQYVDLNESYFSFDMETKDIFPGFIDPTLKSGGGFVYPSFQHIMQLFKHIRITHFSGVVVWEDQYFNLHWLQDRALEIPYEKFIQELIQAKGTTAQPEYETQLRRDRRPGAYKYADYDSSLPGKVSSQQRWLEFNSVDVDEAKRRNLPYFTIHPKTKPALVNEGVQDLGSNYYLDAKFPDAAANAFVQAPNLVVRVPALAVANNTTTATEVTVEVKGESKSFPTAADSQKLALLADFNKTNHVSALAGYANLTDDKRWDHKVTYHIPFHWIPFFRHEQNSLMPSMLANGMRIEFVLADTWDFYAKSSNFPLGVRNAKDCHTMSYEITNFRTNLQLIDLTARIYALLLQESINTGLYWVTDATYTTMSQSVGDAFMIECTRALSRCKMVKAIPYIQSALNQTAKTGTLTNLEAINGEPTTHFSYASANVGFRRWRFVLGSMSYPAQDCEEPQVDVYWNNKHESYDQLMHAYGYNDQRSDDGSFITYGDYCNSGVYQACVSLERSPTMQQTGLSLSTDASLRFIATLGSSQQNNVVVDTNSKIAVFVFVTHSTTCQIIGDKVIVKN